MKSLVLAGLAYFRQQCYWDIEVSIPTDLHSMQPVREDLYEMVS